MKAYSYAALTGVFWAFLNSLTFAIALALLSGLPVRPVFSAFLIAGLVGAIWEYRQSKDARDNRHKLISLAIHFCSADCNRITGAAESVVSSGFLLAVIGLVGFCTGSDLDNRSHPD